MSLTSFLEGSPAVRARLLSEFTKPEFRVKAAIKAPPLSESYGLTGTAFDYLLRFYVQKLNPSARTHYWTAQLGLLGLGDNETQFATAKRMILEAQGRHERFLASRRRRPTRELAEATVMLAYLETIFRSGIVDDNAFKSVPSAVVDDLEAMLALVRPEHFRAVKRCVLNPTFGLASALVGGADADLLIDDTLIDIKTGKHLVFYREIFNQLVGYYVLSCIGGIDNCPRGGIKHLAVYYARYGILHRVRVSDFVVKDRMPAFLRWFKKCAKREA